MGLMRLKIITFDFRGIKNDKTDFEAIIVQSTGAYDQRTKSTPDFNQHQSFNSTRTTSALNCPIAFSALQLCAKTAFYRL